MKKIFNTFLFLMITVAAFSQEKHRFENDVKIMKAYDKIYEPTPASILFVGSSSIRKWQHLQTAFGSYSIINRGIGGAVIDDITYYLDDLVFTYKPRQIVLYVGENDLPNDKETADTILNKTMKLFNAIRAGLPEVPIAYIALKPSPVRDQFQEKCIAANNLIRDFLATQPNTRFVDIFSAMIKDGKSRPELFMSDMLHMKPEGYEIWEKAVKRVLLKPIK
jgi:lysophospholipase L1-like esterase